MKKAKLCFKPKILRIRLSQEQAVLYCSCYANGTSGMLAQSMNGNSKANNLGGGPISACYVTLVQGYKSGMNASPAPLGNGNLMTWSGPTSS
jgi:hypothetical protein